MFGFRFILLMIVSVIYLVLLFIVTFKVWKVKKPLRYRLAIWFATVFLAPAGYWWYRWARKKFGVKKKTRKKSKDVKSGSLSEPVATQSTTV